VKSAKMEPEEYQFGTLLSAVQQPTKT